MQQSDVFGGDRLGANMRYAGFGGRLVALIIDSIILGIVSNVLGLLIGSRPNEFSAGGPGIGLLLSVVYYGYFLSSTGQTLGGRAMGIKVVDANGNTLSVGSAILRDLASIISGIIFGIGYLMMLWDGKKQTLHDKIAGSYVVKL